LSEICAGRYTLRFPDALGAIDPEFLNRWVLPWFREDGSLPAVPETDLSPLARYDTDLPEETPAELRAFLDFTPAPLTREEEERLVEDADDPDRESRLFFACLPAVLSLALGYCPGEERLPLLLADGLEELLAAIRSYAPGTCGGFRGYALWRVRIRMIRELWDTHPENPRRNTGKLLPEYRLHCPEKAFALSEGEAVPAVAASAGKTALIYRTLREKEPEIFAAVMEQMTPRELRVLELLLTEGCLLTLWDGADRFGVTEQRIRQIFDKFLRRTRHTLRKISRGERLACFLET